ncbi:hypothetical protein JTE90_006994 [Oedothorax gibbosus]|uniref:Uncharacterized protein n=1 Tax=Oedothorax gibbosus TaxID=931172 RepID=A0AAV6V961_9ARAC|nr:hypothetical protein JTE90_006994 [Oedothorax gibbosus]
MGEFVEISSYEPPASSYPVNFTTVAPTNSPANFLYNKYVVIGVLTFFVTIFLLTIIIHIVRSRICAREPLHHYSIASEEGSSLMGSDDENLDNLYTSCQLYVAEDDELPTGDDFEYDCSSLDGGLSVTERKALKPYVDQRRVIGALAFFVTIFLLTIIVHIVRSRICNREPIHHYSIVSEEGSSLMSSVDENLDNLYIS